MAASRLDSVFQQLRRIVLVRDGARLTDAQLLELFISQKDQAAFEAIVRRYGSMVLRVCNRVVRNHHDAEDAYQATFLLLAQKASSVRQKERVANWLHGVAFRTALNARKMRAKNRLRERQVIGMPEPQILCNDSHHDLQSILDQEVNRLADVYRLPILLCDLEGKSIKKTAQQLGWPQGTVAGRLARGRKMLAKRLARHGLAMTGGAVFLQNAASASVSPMLVASTVKAASAIISGKSVATGPISANVAVLMKGVVTSMFTTKIKIATAVLVVGSVLALGSGMVLNGTAGGQQIEGGQVGGQKPAIRQVSLATENRQVAQLTDKLNEESGGKKENNEPDTDKTGDLQGMKEVTYAVTDLVVPGSLGQKAPMRIIGRNLTDAITADVAPNTWSDVGGQATLKYDPVKKRLAIRQSPENHEQIESLLNLYRRLLDLQIALEVRFLKIPDSVLREFGLKVSQSEGALAVSWMVLKDRLADGEILPLQFTSEKQVGQLLTSLQMDRRIESYLSPKLLTLNGKEEHFSSITQHRFVTEIDVDQEEGQVKIRPKIEDIPIGVRLWTNAVLSADRHFVRVHFKVNLSSLNSAIPLLPENTHTKIESKTVVSFVQKPTVNKKEMETRVNLPNDGLLILNCGKIPSEKATKSGEKQEAVNVIVLFRSYFMPGDNPEGRLPQKERQ